MFAPVFATAEWRESLEWVRGAERRIRAVHTEGRQARALSLGMGDQLALLCSYIGDAGQEDLEAVLEAVLALLDRAIASALAAQHKIDGHTYRPTARAVREGWLSRVWASQPAPDPIHTRPTIQPTAPNA